MKKWTKTLILSGMVALGSVACDDLGTEPNGLNEDAIRAEAALVAANGMFQDLSLAQEPGLQSFGFGGMGSGHGLLGPMGGPGQCQGQGQGAFNCPNMVREGFTFTREVTFYDAKGEVQPEGFDAASTDAIRMVSDASGTVERTFWTATMDRSRDMLIEGLLSGAHTLNGTGSGITYRSGNPAEGVERTFDMSSIATWTNVVHHQPREENPYPLSGTVARHIVVTVTENGEVIGSRDVETLITFKGTQFVTLLVDGEKFEIDLATKGVKGRFGMGGNHG
jgi:hypothetical protein